MERISITIVFCVALIIGIIWQAPPQVYKNVSDYYERLGGKGRASVQSTNSTVTPARKARPRKPATNQAEKLNTASFSPFDEESAKPQPDNVPSRKEAAPSRK